MRHSTEHALRHPSPSTATLACHLAVLALLAITAPVKAQDAAPAAAGDPLVPNVSYSPGQYAKIEGTIVSRKGDALLVRRQNSNEMSVVTLTERTDIESPAGVLNLERKKQDMARLQPGLFLKVRGHGGDQKELVAERISFHRSALRVTNQIASGQVELREEMDARLNAHNDSINVARARGREELSALTSRIADLDAYDEKFSGSVRFSTGSAVLSAEAKSTLDSLVSIGTGLNGSLVEVAGFADSRGSPEFNHQLSQRRVDAVIAYLAGTHSVPLRKIVNPTGLGESNPVGSNNTDEGRALNRRVEIRILVNRGMNTLNPSEKKSQDNNAQPAMPNSATPRSTPDTSNPRTSPDNSTEPNSSNEPTTPNSVPMPMTPRDSTKP